MADARWLLVFALLFVAVDAIVYRRFALAKITYQRLFSQSSIVAGETVEMVELIENRKFLPVPHVVLEAAFDSSMHFNDDTDAFMNRTDRFLTMRSIFSLSPYTRVTRKHRIRCIRRGVYRLNSAAMTAGGVFGGTAFMQWTFTGEGTELTVYPKLMPHFDTYLSSHSFQGDTVVRRYILPDPFIRQGSRPYQFGDPLNQINWKATARTGNLHVHLQEFTADYYVKILLNFIVEEDMWQHISDVDRIEGGISLAATLASDLSSRGISVGFNCNGTQMDGELPEVLAGSGPRHLRRLWSAMAGLQMVLRCDCGSLLKEERINAQRRTDFVLITGYVDDILSQEIRHMEADGHSVTVLPLPTDDELQTVFGSEFTGEEEDSVQEAQ